MRALLLLLLWGGALASDLAHAATEHCHRAHSRQAGRIIERAISPLVRAKQYTLPEGCPLDASLSVFTRQEQHKRVVRKGVWQCDFDRKVRSRRCARVHHWPSLAQPALLAWTEYELGGCVL